MIKKMNLTQMYTCNICNKEYSSQSSLCNHNKRFHQTNINKCQPLANGCQPLANGCKPKIRCENCNKEFNTRQSKSKHKKKCTVTNKIDDLKEKNKIKQLEETIKELKTQPLINNQLINLIVDKTNIIEELKNKIDETKSNNNLPIKINNNIQLQQYKTLKLNNVNIISRCQDNYINATQLCQAGNKQFYHWFCLNITLLIEAVYESEIPISQLINIKKENTTNLEQEIWIHPDLAILLAQWISPLFALQVSKWTRTLFINDIQLLKDKNKEIKMKDNKIKLLEDLCIKKQQRKEYP